MSDPVRVELPTSAVPFRHTVRGTHYLRVVLAQLTPFAAAAWTWRYAENVSSSLAEGSLFRAVVGTSLVLLLLPQGVVLHRLLFGTGGQQGILFGAEATRRWRSRWRTLQETSAALQEKCRRRPSVFALPDPRRFREEPDVGDGYRDPEELLDELPEEPSFVTYGQLTNQPIQVIPAQSPEQAVAVARRMAALIAGRLLGREIPLLAFKSAGERFVRLRFVTVVDPESIHRAYLWTTVHLETNGATVHGFVETVRTYYFGRGECHDGSWYRGDEVRAKQRLAVMGELLCLLTPLSLLVGWWRLKEAGQELRTRQVSAEFFYRYRPSAGDAVDLFLIGESGSDLLVAPSFASRVAGVRSDVLQEIYTVTGLFAGVFGER